MRSGVIWLILLAATAALAADDCAQAEQKQETWLQRLSKTCRVTADCSVQYLHASSCAAPIVARRDALTRLREKELLRVQAGVRQACEKIYRKQPACEPLPAQAECQKHVCVDRLTHPAEKAPPHKAAAVSNNVFPFGFVHHTCAPWDGPALGVQLYQSKKHGDFPTLSINLWRDLPEVPLARPQHFDLKAGTTGSASRCLKNDTCEAAESGWLELKALTKESGAKGSYELHFRDGSVEKGEFEVPWKELREMCG